MLCENIITLALLNHRLTVVQHTYFNSTATARPDYDLICRIKDLKTCISHPDLNKVKNRKEKKLTAILGTVTESFELQWTTVRVIERYVFGFLYNTILGYEDKEM